MCVAAIFEHTTGCNEDDCVFDLSRRPPCFIGHVWLLSVCERERAGECGADVGGVAKSSKSERPSSSSSTPLAGVPESTSPFVRGVVGNPFPNCFTLTRYLHVALGSSGDEDWGFGGLILFHGSPSDTIHATAATLAAM